MRTMRWMSLCMALALVRTATARAGAPVAEDAPELRVLYAGDPESPRTEAWVTFLEEWFPEVGAISLSELDEAAAEPYDVVVADWRARYVNGNYSSDSSHQAGLASGFSRPIVMIGAVGAELSRRHAFSWL